MGKDTPAGNLSPGAKEIVRRLLNVALIKERLRGEKFVGAPVVSQAPKDPARMQEAARPVRFGQPKFRKILLHDYASRCAVTNDGPIDVLDAAHIRPHHKDGLNHSSNGLLLRSDIHAMLDLHLLRVLPKSLKIEVDASLKGTGYWKLRGRRLGKSKGEARSNERLEERLEAWRRGS